MENINRSLNVKLPPAWVSIISLCTQVWKSEMIQPVRIPLGRATQHYEPYIKFFLRCFEDSNLNIYLRVKLVRVHRNLIQD